MFHDKFEQHFPCCVLNTRNNYKSRQNQMNSFNASNNEVMKIFCGFRVFEYALWQIAKTWKCRKSAESFLNKKIYRIY